MNAVTIVKILATLLITNSHFDGLYPPCISMLATGGMIGNALFFFISGYTLYFSISKLSSKRDNIAWFVRRIFRIYPSVWIFSLLIWTMGNFVDLDGFSSLTIKDFFITKYWFVNAIIVCYVLYYLIMRSKSNRKIIAILMLISYIVLFFMLFLFKKDEFGFIIEDIEGRNIYFRYLYLFSIMLFGGWTASRFKENMIVRGKWRTCSVMIGSIVCYYGLKYVCIYSNMFYLQIMVPVLLTITTFFIWQFALSFKYSNIGRVTGNVLKYVSGLTLDIYIVQFVLIWLFEKIDFPFGFIGAILSITLASILLNYVSKRISEPMIKMINSKIK